MTSRSENEADESVVRDLIAAFCKADLEKMSRCLAEDLQSYITAADGGVTHLNGRAAFMDNIRAMDVASVRPVVTITQILTIQPGQVMVMVEIKAKRKGRSLHNFAAYLVGLQKRAITSLHMVEALPAYSDSFWKD
ncbi:MAG: nuclear transport factor 2 family protein [Pseudomonadota bacterium]